MPVVSKFQRDRYVTFPQKRTRIQSGILFRIMEDKVIAKLPMDGPSGTGFQPTLNVAKHTMPVWSEAGHGGPGLRRIQIVRACLLTGSPHREQEQ